MPLPELIEIIPPAGPVRAEITVPGSKSITNRALILGALADGETTLSGALWSEDTQVMVECLRELGFLIEVSADPQEACNRRLTIYGRGGLLPPGGSLAQPMDLFVGNAGTAARFLAAFLCLGKGAYRLEGTARMHERPQAALFEALRELGYQVDSANDKLPAVIHGRGPRPGRCQVNIEESSQFASALLLAAERGQWRVEVVGSNAEESPYVTMTDKLLEVFPKTGGRFSIEPDASSGSYFIAAQRCLGPNAPGGAEPRGAEIPVGMVKSVTVRDWPQSGWQVDERFPRVWDRASAEAVEAETPRSRERIPESGDGKSPSWRSVPPECAADWTISRERDLGDSIMTAIVMAPLLNHPLKFADLGRLRVQECERVLALRTELSRCGAQVIESGDSLEVYPSALKGAEIETYNDHRMAMCFTILGLKIEGIKIKNPTCVKKTFPDFFQKLAAPAPLGLGIELRDATSGRRLPWEELFAE